MEMADTWQYIPCKAEIQAPTIDWSITWKLVRLKGLDSELTSFNFKLIHGLLVTKKRMHQLNPVTQPTCSHCNDHVKEDIQHAMLDCSYNDGAGQSLLAVVQNHLPQFSPQCLLQLELGQLQEEV